MARGSGDARFAPADVLGVEAGAVVLGHPESSGHLVGQRHGGLVAALALGQRHGWLRTRSPDEAQRNPGLLLAAPPVTNRRALPAATPDSRRCAALSGLRTCIREFPVGRSHGGPS